MPLTTVDRTLLQRCLQHHRGAWNDFVDRFLGLVYHVVQHTADMRSYPLRPEDKEDVAAQVLLKIVEHNLEVELESARVEKKLFDTNLKPGETRTADFTFSQAGKWEMYCPVDSHKQRGMDGSVTVAAANAMATVVTVPSQ